MMGKTCVIYARYSCSSQRDVSIDQQVKACQEYCLKEHIEVVKVYADYAISGTTDDRPQFQLMIDRAPESDYVVVYMMERFSRNAYDPAIYKKKLAQVGVKVLSACEYIPDAPEGILIEKILEGQAAYFSLDVARKTKRGMADNASKCMANGVKVFGYDVDSEQHYVVNEEHAEIVREIFNRYLNGETMNAIGRSLAERGVKSTNGGRVDMTFARRVLHNDKYIGVYRFGDTVIPGGMPAIVDKSVFEAAQKKRPKKDPKSENFSYYPLSGKLWCGKCDRSFVGTSSRGHNKVKYSNYICKSCGSKMDKFMTEQLIADNVIDLLSVHENAEVVAKAIAKHLDKVSGYAALEAKRKELVKVENKMKRALDIIIDEDSVFDREVAKNKYLELQDQKQAIKLDIKRLEGESIGVDIDALTNLIQNTLSCDDSDAIIDTFVNKVALFDDKYVVTCNYHDMDNSLAEIVIAMGRIDPPPSEEVRIEKRLGHQPPFVLTRTSIFTLRGGFGFIIAR